MHYVDIGAQRVQTWLIATPKLDHLRGASAALASVTSAASIDAWLAAQKVPATRCQAAGDKDGVVVLECADADASAATASTLLRYLTAALPRVEWAGWSAEASTYLRAYTLAESRAPGVRRYRLLPSTFDVPVLEQCEECRQEARRRGSNGAVGQGADCHVRHAHAADGQTLLDVVPGEWPKDFQQLARLGGRFRGADKAVRVVGRKDSTNHLALVKADGNKVGALFKAIGEHEADLPTLVRESVRDLDNATRDAVEAAARAVTDGGASVKGAIAHYVGGDDVLVTVPAASVWRFVAELVAHFEILHGTWLARLDSDAPRSEVRAKVTDLIEQVSLGVGVVIAHETHPLSDLVSMADDAMKAAKALRQGSASAVAWVDLTAEGMAGAQPGETWLQRVTGYTLRVELNHPGNPASDLTAAIMALPPSARAQLGLEVRDAHDLDVAKAAVLTWCGRRDDEVTPIKDAAAAGRITEIAALLSRARWWPLAATEETR